MADDKEAPEYNGQTFAFQILGLAAIIMVLGTVLERQGISNFLSLDTNGQNPEEVASNEENADFENELLSSKLSLGDYTSNIDPVVVRQSPGGAPVGRQSEGEKGRLMEGPVDRFDTEWWRIDYSDAPDGWVEGNLLTSNRNLYTALNIVPITLGFLKPVGVILSVILFVLILIVVLKIKNFNKIETKKKEIKSEQEIYKKGHAPSEESFEPEIGPEELPIAGLPIGEKPETQKPSNRRWENIQSLTHSYNSNDWKQAIIEADTILDEMLQKMGYSGNSIGERLKQVEQSDFTTLNQAWEAHKIRNRIAHSGTNYIMSKDEADRVIDLYKQVFSEFYYI